MISIIVPFYNCTKYIDYAKQNFIQFNNEKFELIFVNDGSTDDSLLQLESVFPFAKFYTQKNQGSGVARDTGIIHANGDLIAFCDIDDFMYVNTLEKIASEIGEADIAIGQSYRTWIKDNKPQKRVLWKNKIFEKTNFYPKDYPCVYSDSIMMNKVYKTQFLKNSGCKFPTGKYEDKKYLFDLFNLNPLIKTFEYHFYDWNIFENSTSQTNTKNLDDIIQRFEVCMYQINNSEGELKKFLIGNTISHDIILYSKDYQYFNTEAKERLYSYYIILNKMAKNVEKEFFTVRGQSLLDKIEFKDFNAQMLKLAKKPTLFARLKGKVRF